MKQTEMWHLNAEGKWHLFSIVCENQGDTRTYYTDGVKVATAKVSDNGNIKKDCDKKQ